MESTSLSILICVWTNLGTDHFPVKNRIVLVLRVRALGICELNIAAVALEANRAAVVCSIKALAQPWT